MNIVGILSFDFLKPVGLALLMTMPLSWLLMSKWLENFAYRITISWWIYFSAALISLAIALFTIGYQAIRAALANPVDSLRSE
jgi:putative ABC transport system permease protein